MTYENPDRLLVKLCHQLSNADMVSQSREPEVPDTLGSWRNDNNNRRALLIILRERRMVLSGRRKA